jgi:predicted enzyme related to lactoylglutathione lyase
MAQPSVQGRFVWEALLAEDPAAVTAFYSTVLGWRSEPWPHDPKYTIFAAQSGPVASATQLTEAQRAEGARPRWLPFIGAENVDATVAGAEKLGAKVLRAAADVDQIGRYAIIADPQGAAFAIYKPLQVPAHKAPPQHGELAWQELATTDYEGAFDFYRALFGWQLIERMDMGAMGFYLIFGSDGVQRGGIYKLSQPAPGPFWLAYTSVPNADKAAAAATKAGGRLLHGPTNVPGGGRIAQLTDPSGVAFAVHSMAKAAAAPPPSPPAASAPKPPAAQTSAPPPPKAAAKPAPAPTSAPAAAPAKPAPVAAPPAAAKPAAPAKPAPVKAAPKKKAVVKKAAKPAARKVAKKAAKKVAKKAAKKKAAARKAFKKPARKAAKKAAKKAGKKKAGKSKSARRAASKKARRKK